MTYRCYRDVFKLLLQMERETIPSGVARKSVEKVYHGSKSFISMHRMQIVHLILSRETDMEYIYGFKDRYEFCKKLSISIIKYCIEHSILSRGIDIQYYYGFKDRNRVLLGLCPEIFPSLSLIGKTGFILSWEGSLISYKGKPL